MAWQMRQACSLMLAQKFGISYTSHGVHNMDRCLNTTG